MSKSYSAVKWNGISSLVNQGVTVLVGILLMRLLSPDDFGLLGMVTVLTGFLHILKDAGLGASIIFKKDLNTSDLNTVFWFNVFLGFLLCLVVFGLSYPLSLYYDEPRLNAIVKVFSLTFLLSSTTVVHASLLQKRLAFKQKFYVEIISNVVSGIAGVVLALYDFGVWALVWMNLFRVIVYTILIWFVSFFMPQLSFSLLVLKGHFSYSMSVFGTKSFNYWTRNADNFFVGKFLGSEALGFYSRAFFFVTFPVQKFTNVLGGVLFPAMSQKHHTPETIVTLLLRSIRIVAMVTFPLIGFLLINVEPLVMIVFGSKWLPMLPSLRILLILAILESVLVLTTPAYYALDATKLNFFLSAVQGTINIICFYIGSHYSIELVALLLLCSTAFITFPRVYYIIKLTDSSVGQFVNSVGKISVVTMVAIGSTLLLSVWLKDLQQIQTFTYNSVVYIAVYAVLGVLLMRKNFTELLSSFQLVLKN